MPVDFITERQRAKKHYQLISHCCWNGEPFARSGGAAQSAAIDSLCEITAEHSGTAYEGQKNNYLQSWLHSCSCTNKHTIWNLFLFLVDRVLDPRKNIKSINVIFKWQHCFNTAVWTLEEDGNYRSQSVDWSDFLLILKCLSFLSSTYLQQGYPLPNTVHIYYRMLTDGRFKEKTNPRGYAVCILVPASMTEISDVQIPFLVISSCILRQKKNCGFVEAEKYLFLQIFKNNTTQEK